MRKLFMGLVRLIRTSGTRYTYLIMGHIISALRDGNIKHLKIFKVIKISHLFSEYWNNIVLNFLFSLREIRGLLILG